MTKIGSYHCDEVFEMKQKNGLLPVGGAKQKSPTSTQSLDPAYSHLLKQQQVFLQLQILQNQQQQQLQPQPQPQLAVVSRCEPAIFVYSLNC